MPLVLFYAIEKLEHDIGRNRERNVLRQFQCVDADCLAIQVDLRREWMLNQARYACIDSARTAECNQ